MCVDSLWFSADIVVQKCCTDEWAFILNDTLAQLYHTIPYLGPFVVPTQHFCNMSGMLNINILYAYCNEICSDQVKADDRRTIKSADFVNRFLYVTDDR